MKRLRVDVCVDLSIYWQAFLGENIRTLEFSNKAMQTQENLQSMQDYLLHHYIT